MMRMCAIGSCYLLTNECFMMTKISTLLPAMIGNGFSPWRFVTIIGSRGQLGNHRYSITWQQDFILLSSLQAPALEDNFPVLKTRVMPSPNPVPASGCGNEWM